MWSELAVIQTNNSQKSRSLLRNLFFPLLCAHTSRCSSFSDHSDIKAPFVFGRADVLWCVKISLCINGWYRLFPSASFTTALFDVRHAGGPCPGGMPRAVSSSGGGSRLEYYIFISYGLAAAGAFSQSPFMQREHVGKKSTLNKN